MHVYAMRRWPQRIVIYIIPLKPVVIGRRRRRRRSLKKNGRDGGKMMRCADTLGSLCLFYLFLYSNGVGKKRADHPAHSLKRRLRPHASSTCDFFFFFSRGCYMMSDNGSLKCDQRLKSLVFTARELPPLSSPGAPPPMTTKEHQNHTHSGVAQRSPTCV